MIKATIISKSQPAQGTIEFKLKTETAIAFKPGQYFWVKINLKYTDPKGDRRAFSAISKVGEDLAFVVRISNSGFKRTLDEALEGEEVMIDGPFGSTYQIENEGGKNFFVAGGVGIAPFLSIIRNQDRFAKPATLVYLNQTIDRSAYLEELKKKAQEDPNFELVELFNQKDLVKIEEIAREHTGDWWQICGPKGLVEALGDSLMTLGISEDKLKCEEFYPGYIKDLKTEDNQAFRLAVSNSSNHIVITDINGVVKYANQAATAMTGYSFEEMEGQTPRLWGGLMAPELYAEMWHQIKDLRQPYRGKLKNRRKNGEIYVAQAIVSPIIDHEDNLVGFVGTEEDVTMVEEIDRAKSEFVSLASHQLRTPLSTVKWYGEMLLNGEMGEVNKQQRECVEQITSANNRMIELVNSLLNVSRIEMGTFVIETEDCNLREEVQKAIDDVASLAEKQQVTVEIEERDTLDKIKADSRLLHIVLMNLISNAVKYSKNGGKVKVVIKEYQIDEEAGGKMIEEKGLGLMVADNGIGIPENQQKSIFGKMFRGENARSHQSEGDGLGLYIVKSVIEAAGGMIWFTSEENLGTTFYIWLPPEGMRPKSGNKKLD